MATANSVRLKRQMSRSVSTWIEARHRHQHDGGQDRLRKGAAAAR